MSTRGRWIRAAVIGLVVLLIAGRWLAANAADAMWSAALGVAAPHAAIRSERLVLAVLAFVAAAAWCAGNFYVVYRSIGSVHVPRRLGNLEIVEAVPRRYLLIGAIGVGVILAYAMSHGAGDWWTLRALAGTDQPLGLTDPVLGRDFTFYLFDLPWSRAVHGFVTLLAGVVLLFAAFLYVAVGAVRWRDRRLRVTQLARAHLGGLLAVLALALYWGYRLEPAEYVAGVHHVPFDQIMVTVRIPFAHFLAAMALLVAVVSLIWIRLDRAALVGIAWIVLATASFIGHYVAPTFAAAARTRSERQAPAIDSVAARFRHIAFGLSPDTTYAPSAAPRELGARHAAELIRAPVWDEAAAIAALNRSVRGRPYDRFYAAYLTTLPPDGVPAYVGVPEVDLAAARAGDRTMTWERVHHLPYARSRGVYALAASRVGPDGAPRFVADVADADSTAAAPVDLGDSIPVWFSPTAADFAIAQSSDGRFAGVRVGGFLRRLVLAWTLQSPDLLTADDVHAETEVLWDRAVALRLARVAPFARFGAPYPVLHGERLVWVAAGYVWAEGAPLVTPVEWRGRRVGYLRSGIVGIVDASSGATAVYLLPDADPLSRAWARRYPGLVEPQDSIPDFVRSALRYPEGLFRAQLAALTGSDPRLRDTTATRRTPQAYWWVGGLPGDTIPRLRLRAAVERSGPVPGATDLAAIADGVVRDARDELTVLVLANPDAQPGMDALLRTTAGTDAANGWVPGALKAIPFPDGVVALRSAYAETSTTVPPHLSVVTVGWRTALGRGPTIAAALSDVRVAPAPTGSSAAWVDARRWFRMLDSARIAGDWVAFGHAYDSLRVLLGAPPDTGR